MTAIEITFRHAGLTSPRPPVVAWTSRILTLCAMEEGFPGAGISVLYCSAAEIRRLNAEFRSMDKATDVLSFPAEDAPRRLRGREGVFLGDLALCLPYCARQAPEFERSTEQEVALLLVHGFLHLTGYDHDTPAKKAAMWRRTDELLALCSAFRAPRLALRGVK